MARRLTWLAALVVVAAVGPQQVGAQQGSAQQSGVQFAEPADMPPLFFSEPWRQTGPIEASSDFQPERAVTTAAVTNASLELRLYDPMAGNIPAYAKAPPPGSIVRDWGGPSCVQLAGYNQDPPPARVVAGDATNPPNLWTGVCQGPVAVTLRDRRNYVDLRGLARIRWVTRVSGFHVVRPVIKLADGTWLVGDYAEGAPSTNSTLFLESEFAVSSIRWLALDIDRVVTRGAWVPSPDLSRVDEVGFADLLPGSGHGWGGFVNLGRIQVYGKPVSRP